MKFDTRLLKKTGFLLPFLVSIGCVLVVVIGFRIVWSRYGTIRDQINVLKSDNGMLDARVSTLRSIDQAGYSRSVNQATVVLPPFDPTLELVSQIRSKSDAHSLSFEKLALGGSGAFEGIPDVKRTGISFSVKGDYRDIVSFLSEISFSAPITKIIDVKLREGLADVTVESYWSPFPSVLPSINEPLITLSDDNKKVLSNLSSFQLPQFGEPPGVNLGPVERTNPFSL
jgi:Tfp pilus assembly protein PilO